MQAARRLLSRCLLIIVCLLPLVMEQAAQAQVPTTHFRYVDGDRPTSGLGLDWGTAYKYLTDALAYADDHADLNNHYEIWVAKTETTPAYRPDQNAANPGGTGGPAESFNLVKFTSVYGGFHGDPGGPTAPSATGSPTTPC